MGKLDLRVRPNPHDHLCRAKNVREEKNGRKKSLGSSRVAEGPKKRRHVATPTTFFESASTTRCGRKKNVGREHIQFVIDQGKLKKKRNSNQKAKLTSEKRGRVKISRRNGPAKRGYRRWSAGEGPKRGVPFGKDVRRRNLGGKREEELKKN